MICDVQWSDNTEYMLLELLTYYNNEKRGAERIKSRYSPYLWGDYNLYVQKMWTRITAMITYNSS